MSHHLTLDGLRLEPLGSYTAALGVLRLVTEQGDPDAQGWWQGERFHLQSTLDEASLLTLFLQDYRPTPMAAPWNGSGGVFERSEVNAVTQIEESRDQRFADYRAALAIIDKTLKAHDLKERPGTPRLKFALLWDLHTDLTPEARRYLDAVLTLKDGDVTYHSLFLTGGNSGRFDFAKTFMDSLTKLLVLDEGDAKVETPTGSAETESLLRAAMFDNLTDHLEPGTAGPHHPGSSGGFNSSNNEPVGESLTNPWTYVLGMEGTLLFPGGRGEVEHASVGYPSAVPDETSKRDLCLPVWSTPQTLEQVEKLLAQDPGSHTLRYNFLPRNGRSFFAIPVGRRTAPKTRRPMFLRDLEWQLKEDISSVLQEKLLEEPVDVAQVVEALGALPEDVAAPLRLPKDWISAAVDGTPEFGCALALSGLGRGLTDPHLEFAPQFEHFGGPDLCARMLSLLRVRARFANQASKLMTPGGYPRFNAPFWSTHPARPRHIEAFLAGGLDEARIERLLRGLRLVQSSADAPPHEPAFLPYAFSIAKLAFHQHQDRRPAPVEIAEALVANRPDDAVATAARFLKVRHPDFPQHWPPCPPLEERTSRRWAAALLFPIADTSYQAILGDLCAQ